MDEDQTHARAAEERVRSWILTGELAVGASVNERGIAERLGLSRTPVREAIGRLEAEGRLKRQGRSLVVREISLEEVMEVLAVRLLLECEATYLATTRLKDKELALMRAAVEGLTTPEETTPAVHWDVDDMVHLTIADVSGNKHFARIIRDMRERTRIFGLDRIPNRFDIGRAEHLDIIAALEARDADRAKIAMGVHIQNARRSIIQSLTGEL